MQLPLPRGPLSAWTVATLSGVASAPPEPHRDVDALRDDDLQLALWCCYELHYRGFDDVDDALEWQPGLLTFRATLESLFLAALRALVGSVRFVPAARIPAELSRVTRDFEGPALSSYLQRHATKDEFSEFVAHRSVYHLKEADPHTFAIPRLGGRAKAALIEIQADEYGGGRVERVHATLFARLMTGLGLDPAYGTYVNRAPGVTLATSNLMSFFGLHRRWRAAAAGHLAALELTSSLPNRRYGQGLRRLGGDDASCLFFDEHVEADAVHEQIASYDLCRSLAEDEPDLAADIVFGASCCLALDAMMAERLLTAWQAGNTSLLPVHRRAA